MVDHIAYACASQFSRKYCETLSVDRVLFKVPVRVGDLLTMRVQVNHVGRTSMEVGVRVEARDLRGSAVRHMNSCYLTMVALDEGKPSPVPHLVCETGTDRWRQNEAVHRREKSNAMKRIEESEKRFRSVIDLASVAILLIETDTGLVRRANREACSLLGSDREVLESHTVWELQLPAKQREARAFWESVVMNGYGEAPVLDHLHASGSHVSLAVTAWVIPLPTHSLIQRTLRPAGCR